MDWKHRLTAHELRDIDGDTFYVTVPAFDAVFTADIRLAGIDTQEIYGTKKDSDAYKKGEAQKQFVEDWFGTAGTLVLLTDFKKGEYGRWIADVSNGSETLSDALLAEYGDSVRYDG